MFLLCAFDGIDFFFFLLLPGFRKTLVFCEHKSFWKEIVCSLWAYNSPSYLPLIYSVLRFIVVSFQTNLCALNLKDFKSDGNDFQLKDEEEKKS